METATENNVTQPQNRCI